MNRLKALVLAPLLSVSFTCFAYTGNDLQQWSRSFEAMQNGGDADWKASMFVGYVAGVSDTVRGIVVCPKGKTTHLQNAAIVSKYIRQNPEQWTDDGAMIVTAALRKAYPACSSE